MKLLLFCLVSLHLSVGHADPKNWVWQWRKAQPRHFQFKTFSTDQMSNKVAVAMVSGIYPQKIDHNSDQSSTFSQRYWINRQYAKAANPPVLYFICGEGACGPEVLEGAVAGHAVKLGAVMVALEHRYYGQSQPFLNLQTENLRYLSIDQALKDLVTFQQYAKENLGLTGPWIAIGGSYAGAMAAYLKSQYPDLFVGALASSGPVQADNDFSEYDRHVALQTEPACLTAVKKVVQQIEAAMAEPGKRVKIQKLFKAETLKEELDFIYLLADVASIAVQYGLKDNFCNFVIHEGLDGYAKAADTVSGLFGNLILFSAQAAEDTTLAANSGIIGMRQWFYQACTEFGFWQNANSDSQLSARSPRINAEYHARLCKRLFNIETPAKVEETNAKYLTPLLQDSAENIYFTNGSEDPWMNLSIVKTFNPKISVRVMENAAHCDDLGLSSNSSVITAQSEFQQLAQRWTRLEMTLP